MRIQARVLAGMLVAAACWLPPHEAASLTPLPSEPEQVRNAAAGMYRWALAHPGAGLSSKAERRDLEMFLAPELVVQFDRAEAAAAVYAAQAAADEKPRMLEGDLLVDGVEGAHEVALAEPVIDGDRARITVTVIHIDERYSKAHRNRAIVWTDVVELQRVGFRWFVSDVLYRGDPARRLSTLLHEFVETE